MCFHKLDGFARTGLGHDCTSNSSGVNPGSGRESGQTDIYSTSLQIPKMHEGSTRGISQTFSSYSLLLLSPNIWVLKATDKGHHFLASCNLRGDYRFVLPNCHVTVFPSLHRFFYPESQSEWPKGTSLGLEEIKMYSFVIFFPPLWVNLSLVTSYTFQIILYILNRFIMHKATVLVRRIWPSAVTILLLHSLLLPKPLLPHLFKR